MNRAAGEVDPTPKGKRYEIRGGRQPMKIN
jgi:hypothetical protein